ncbi:MAG TPA: DUF6693 family protein [Thermohalobaculum sp.]|nr:DUF6693 family protein [Thermohalobaculum sp.]
MQLPANAHFQCDFGVTEAIGSFIIWLLLTIVTLGLASFVAPYYVLSSIINQTWIADQNGQRMAHLKVNFTLAEIVGHAVIWVLLTIVTLGLALIVYYYMVMKKVLNRTEIIQLDVAQSRASPVQSAVTRA